MTAGPRNDKTPIAAGLRDGAAPGRPERCAHPRGLEITVADKLFTPNDPGVPPRQGYLYPHPQGRWYLAGTQRNERQRAQRPGQVFSRRARSGALFTHSVYRIYQFVPGYSGHCTVPRYPVERAVSHYYFIQQPPLQNRAPRNTAQTALLDNFDYKASKRFLIIGTWLFDNMQTRYLTGWTQYLPASTALLEVAKSNLRDRYATFGLQSRFNGLLARIAGVFDWEIGTNEAKPAKQTRIEKTVTPKDLEAGARNNLLDAALFDYAQGLFCQRGIGA